KSVATIFWVVMVLALGASVFIPAPVLFYFDVLWFGLVGILGLFLIFLWFGTDHQATKGNLNLLWALPTWLYAAVSIVRGKLSGRFFRIHALLMFLIMVFWGILPQEFHPAA